MTLDFTIKCSKCGDELEEDSLSYSLQVIEIKPCQRCIGDAVDTAKETADSEGYDRGFDKGYDEGKKDGIEEAGASQQ